MINCLLHANFMNNVPPISVKYEDIHDQDPMADACKIMLSSLRHLYLTFPKEHELKPGTIVSLRL